LAQRGQILPVFALMLAFLLLPVTALAVDGGLLLSAHAGLVGTAEAAAESGSQAIDVNAMDVSGTFQLCGSPDGGGNCGNGVGDVAEVVDDMVDAGVPGPAQSCQAVPQASLAPASGVASGCRLALLSDCQDRIGARPELTDGVAVVIWTTAHLPLLGFGPWSSVVMHASATAWMAHGFNSAIPARGGTGSAC
jgi:hypothetical protein